MQRGLDTFEGLLISAVGIWLTSASWRMSALRQERTWTLRGVILKILCSASFGGRRKGAAPGVARRAAASVEALRAKAEDG
jgi:hypothetical protein